MKTKKVVVGAMTAAILSLNVCALPVTYAAGETVQISVGTVQVEPGDTVSVDVSMSGIPSSGIQACDFAIEFDTSVLDVADVTAGALTETGADEADSTSSMVELFNKEIFEEDGIIELMWSTSLEDSQYWLSGDGVFCTLSFKVAEDAEPGSYPLEVKAIERETYPGSGVMNTAIGVGYYDGESGAVRYEASVTNGEVVIGSEETTSGDGATKRGDANVDGNVDINDAVLIMSYMANKSAYPIEGQGAINADVEGDGDGIGLNDSLRIQKFLAKMISEL